jgi:peptide deformylase
VPRLDPPRLEGVAEGGQIKETGELDAQAEARRQLALAQIRHYPDPVLRMAAHEVEDFDGDLGGLVERLEAIMRDANGVGLAATQLGVLRRVFVFQQDEEQTTAVVNPRIVERSEEREIEDEGCLSMQGVLVPVERPVTVAVEAHDPGGKELRLELSGLAARVAQHELDHLDGVLIIDRTTSEGRRGALAKLRPKPVLGSLR